MGGPGGPRSGKTSPQSEGFFSKVTEMFGDDDLGFERSAVLEVRS